MMPVTLAPIRRKRLNSVMPLIFHRMYWWRWLAGCMVLWAVATKGATNFGWVVNTWQSKDGLPNNAVNSLCQTRDGFIWVATRNGLARFDGAHFEKYPLLDTNGILMADISTLLSAKADGVWLAQNHGPLIHLSFGGAQKTVANFPRKDSKVVSLLEEDDGSLLVATASGVMRITDGQMKIFTAEDGMPDGASSSFAKDGKGQVWLSKGTHVGIIQGGHFKDLAELKTDSTRLASAKAGGVWIFSNNQLFRHGDDGGLRLIGTMGDASVGSTVLLEAKNGLIWIGTRRNGLFCFDGSKFQSVPTSQSAIFCLLEDRQGNIWAGTGGGGLDLIRPKIIQTEGAATGVASRSIQSVSESPDGRLFGLAQSGLPLLRTNGQWSLISSHTNWPGLTVAYFAADRDGSLWMGTTSRRLVRWQDDHFTFWELEAGAADSFFRKVFASSSGDIWIGRGPLERLQRVHADVLETVALPPNFRHIRDIAEAPEGIIYVASDAGEIAKTWNNGGHYETKRVEGLSQQAIRCLTATPDGSLWIGYEEAGLGRLTKDGRFALIGLEEGLYDSCVSQIVDDRRGSLWFGSNHGIFRVQKRSLDALADGRLTNIHSVHYGTEEGLPPLSANPENAGAAVLDHDGRVWMPMGTTLAVINPEEVQEDGEPPEVLLTGVEIDGHKSAFYGGNILPLHEAIALEETNLTLSLEPSHHEVKFDFTTLNFGGLENIYFRYKLEGLDDAWSKSAQQRSVTYSRLSPGKYRFHVMACNSSGVWNEAGASFGFRVLPFVWQTWWFRLAALTLFTLMVLSTGRYFYYRQLRYKIEKLEQQAALDKERARIARDLHDDLGGCLTQIVMVSGLNQRGRISTEKARSDVQATARYAIKALDQTVWAINPQNDTVPAFINYTSQFVVDFLRAAEIKCDIDIPEQLPDRPVSAEARHHLFLVIKEAVSNVVHHARASEVKFQITVSDKSLRFCLQDNGIGFAPAPAAPEADGLRNMRQRMDELGGEFKIESTPGAGTCIKLVFQLKPKG